MLPRRGVRQRTNYAQQSRQTIQRTARFRQHSRPAVLGTGLPLLETREPSHVDSMDPNHRREEAHGALGEEMPMTPFQHELLSKMCWEDVPQIDEASLSAGPWRINQILQIRSNAFALCGGCRLASHNTFDAKLLACYTHQHATDSGLRSPNLSEIMSADRLLMEKIFQLVNEENWNLDDALHEYSSVRHDMVAVLQPRPRPNSAAVPMKRREGQRERTPPPQRREAKDKSDKKGHKRGDGKGKAEGKNRLMDNWDKSLFTQGTSSDGQSKPICMRHNVWQCTSLKCAFVHCSPVPKYDGSMCGSTDHNAIT